MLIDFVFEYSESIAMKRGYFTAAALLLGIVFGIFLASYDGPIRSILSLVTSSRTDAKAADSREQEGKKEGKEGLIPMAEAQIASGNFSVIPVGPGALSQRLSAPAVTTPDPDRIARVAAKVIGTVSEIRKRLGEEVRQGDVIAMIDSREVAEAKSAFLAASVNFRLQADLFQREKKLFEQKINAEQQFLRVRATYTEAKLQLDLARQKLAALDLSEAEVNNLENQDISRLQRKEIRAPISGRIIERRVDLGAPVGGEGQEKELFVIADLGSVWADLSVPLSELDKIKEGLPVASSQALAKPDGTIVFVSPVLNQETRSARVIAAFDNAKGGLRPGTYMTATILLTTKPVALLIPNTALQSISSEQVVFVKGPEGFAKREVAIGESDDENTQITFGLEPGEFVATTNTFALKAELGKSEAEHAH